MITFKKMEIADNTRRCFVCDVDYPTVAVDIEIGCHHLFKSCHEKCALEALAGLVSCFREEIEIK